MPGCEGELETASRAGGEPASGFLRYVCGMIVENQLDGGAGRMSGIKKLEEFNKLSATVTVSDQGMNLSGEQIDPGQQAQRTVPLVLVITREGRVNARVWAADRARSLRWPGCRVSHHKRRWLPPYAGSCI